MLGVVYVVFWNPRAKLARDDDDDDDFERETFRPGLCPVLSFARARVGGARWGHEWWCQKSFPFAVGRAQRVLRTSSRQRRREYRGQLQRRRRGIAGQRPLRIGREETLDERGRRNKRVGETREQVSLGQWRIEILASSRFATTSTGFSQT